MSSDTQALAQYHSRLTVDVARPVASTRHDLRELVREWTLVMRRDGLRPESALLAVKSFITEVAAAHAMRYRPEGVAEYGRAELLSDAGQWCIDSYFDLSPHARGFKSI